MDWTEAPKLVPELDVSDLETSLVFYTRILGFTVLYQRPEEAFACLELEAAWLMLEAADGPGRRFRTAPLVKPFGRGANLQIQVRDVRAAHRRYLTAGYEPLIPLEARTYRVEATERRLLQFVAVDPDGYLLRLCSEGEDRDPDLFGGQSAL